MLNTRAVMRSLPLVASVLGRKYGVTVTIGARRPNPRDRRRPAPAADAPVFRDQHV